MLVIDLSFSQITHISVAAIEGAYFKELNLSYNFIEKLDDPYLFPDAPKMESINLSHNLINEIHAKVFDGIRKVAHIYLNNNFISSIEPNTFTNIPTLISIVLSHNLLRKIEFTIFSPSLQKIYLEKNSLESIDFKMNPGGNISYINIQGNTMVNFTAKEMIKHLPYLKQIYLSRDSFERNLINEQFLFNSHNITYSTSDEEDTTKSGMDTIYTSTQLVDKVTNRPAGYESRIDDINAPISDRELKNIIPAKSESNNQKILEHIGWAMFGLGIVALLITAAILVYKNRSNYAQILLSRIQFSRFV